MKDSVVREMKAWRADLIEKSVVLLLLAFAVNLLCTYFVELIGIEVSGVLSGVLLIALVILVVVIRLRNRTKTVTIGAALFLGGDLMPVPVRDYELSELIEQIGRAVFAENGAYERQWIDEPPTEEPGSGENAGRRLAREMMEYIILQRMLIYVSDYMNTRVGVTDEVKTYERGDAPDILISNRILDMVSRDIADRPIFAAEDLPQENLYAVYRDGMYYSKFGPLLPSRTKIVRCEHGNIKFESPDVELVLMTECNGFSKYVDPEISDGLMSPKGVNSLNAIAVDFTINIRLKWTYVFRFWKNDLYGWVDVIEDLCRDFDWNAYLDRIQWNQTKILLRWFKDRQ